MLARRVRIIQNPWPDSVPTDKLAEILKFVAQTRAEHVLRLFNEERWKRPSLGLAILNPAAPIWMRSQDAVLCTIAIGDEGEDFVPNALDKAMQHRDSGRPAGFGVYMDLTGSADGNFVYGFSTQVDLTIGGASAQSEIQDACEAGHALVTFNYRVREARGGWHEAHPDHRWLNEANKPGGSVLAATHAETIYDSGWHD